MSMSLLQLVSLAAVLAVHQDDEAPVVEPQAPPTYYALRGATVHTMVDGEEPGPRTVVVRDGLIEAVLAEEDALGQDVLVLDVSGLHLVPGLIDAHVNHDVEHDMLYVSRGVTLVRDAGNVVHDILMLRRPEIRALGPGPELYICGPALSGLDEQDTMTWGVPNVRAASAVLPEKLAGLAGKAVEMGLEPGAFSFDYLYFRPDMEQGVADALIQMAHGTLGLQVWGPVPVSGSLERVIASGQDGLVTLSFLLPPGKGWAGVTREDLTPALKQIAATTSRQLNVPPGFLERITLLSPLYESSWGDFATRVSEASDDSRSGLERILALQRAAVYELWSSGVTLVPGSGTPFELLFPGDALLDELDQWIAAGIPSGEVLRLATSGAADALGLADQRGQIAPGRIADLVALGADPTAGSLASLRDPELVVVRGCALERWDLEDRDAALREAQRIAREQVNRELDIAPPDMPEGEVLLSGRTQTEAGGQRLSAEHFMVVDLLDGRTAYGTRMVLPGAGPRPEYNVHLVQVFQGDRLESFDLRSDPVVPAGSDQEVLSWTVQGVLAGGSNRMNILRKHTLALYANNTADQPVAFVDFSDTLTALILARHARVGDREEPGVIYPIKFEGNQWEPVQDQWQTMVTKETRAVVGESPHTNTLAIACVDEQGHPIMFQRRIGPARQTLRLFGVEGPGAPPKAGRVFQNK
jgi:hypothetical protein